MDTSDFRQAYRAVRPSIVGLGRRDDPKFLIFGTGFISHDTGWIITNSHVLKPLLIETENKIGVRNDSAAFLFAQTEPPDGFVGLTGMMVVNLQQIALPKDGGPVPASQEPPREVRARPPRQIIPQEPPDVAACKINASDCLPKFLPLRPAAIRHSRSVEVGTPVGILGFPQGLTFPILFDSQADLQLTPLLQTGVISGILPFQGLPKPNSFVLDILVNPGSSGSPLFLSDGTVVGVVYARRGHFSPLVHIDKDRQQLESGENGVYVPTSLGLAVPSARFPKDWISVHEEH